ncbi:hypothetical protein V7S57_02470 [Caulobacter sp. CCNWLY153]|uniref:hypothetical protein n=1 Tax=unclassified Caulobacter TaxID=2648921 RepID=UPI002FF14CBE
MASVAYLREVYARGAKPGAVLLILDDPSLDEPIRLTNWSKALTRSEDGVVQTYHPAAFKVAWKGGGVGEASRQAQLQVGATGEIVTMIRAIENTQPSCRIERVRVAAPDIAERSIRGAHVAEAEVAGGMVKVTLGGRDLSEPACSARYTDSRVPGLYK